MEFKIKIKLKSFFSKTITFKTRVETDKAELFFSDIASLIEANQFFSLASDEGQSIYIDRNDIKMIIIEEA